ncbi:orexin receptor type 2 [Nematostella vectensis]|uniref:orexin receptor type 2 n=1 Tax=Nematostella vectensis TaxID=45351 RepID=UPI0013904FF6|nr:orexin receptor type 2 [Nematostella vectensis]
MDSTTAYQNQSSDNQSLENKTLPSVSSEELEFKAIKIAFYFVILIGSAVGNSLVAYIICSNRRLKTASNFLILNLAICDLLTPLVSIPFDFALEEHEYTWLYGRAMCRLLWPLATLSATSSALTLAAISLDRYLIIMHPFRSRLTKRQVLFIVIGIHFFSCVVVSPYVAFLNLEGSVCQETWPAQKYRKAYTVVLFLVQYAFPLLYMVTMYTMALFQLYSITGKVRGNKMKQTFNSPSGTPTMEARGTRNRTRKHGVCEVSDGSSTIGRLRSKLSLKRKSANTRATWTFIGIVIIFMCFMFPNQFIWMQTDLGNGARDEKAFSKAVIICWLFTYTNSVANPIIFAIFNNDFRSGFRKIFRCIVCLGQGNSRKLSTFLSTTDQGHVYPSSNNGTLRRARDSPQVDRQIPATLGVPEATHKQSQVSFTFPPSFD